MSNVSYDMTIFEEYVLHLKEFYAKTNQPFNFTRSELKRMHLEQLDEA